MDRWDTPREEKYLGLTPGQFNLAFFIVGGAIALAVAAYFGALGAVGDFFGGGGSSSAPAAVGEVTPTPQGGGAAADLTAEDAAAAAVLKLSDLPSGWTKDAPDNGSSDDYQYTGECAILNEESFPGELASAESEDFEGPESQQVSSTASVFSDEAAAKEAMAALNEVFSSCADQFVAAFQEGLLGAGEERGFDTSDVNVSLADLPFPKLGDSTAAYRLQGSMTLQDVPLEFTVDFVLVRVGRTAGGLSYMAFFDVNSFEEEVLAETVAGKLAEANASLAD